MLEYKPNIQRVLQGLALDSLKEIDQKNDVLNLRVHKFIFNFGIFCFAFPLIILIVITFFPEETGVEGQSTFFYVFSALFALVGLYFFSGYFFHKVNTSKEEIMVQSFYLKKRTAKWEEIKKITFVQSTNLLYLHLNCGKSLKISQAMVGILNLLQLLNKKTGIEVDSIIHKMSMR